MENSDLRRLYEAAASGRLSRRDVLRRAAALGLSAPVIAALLAACGGGGSNATATKSTTSGGTTSTATTASSAGAATKAATPAASGATTASPAAPASPQAQTQAPGPGRGKGGAVKILWWQAPTILNPHFSQGTKDFDAARVTLEPLADIDTDGNLVPILAESIPTNGNGVSADGKTVTWKLKKGVTWSDGQPFTSKDVKFTYDFTINKAASTTTYSFYAPIDSIDTPDDQTVVIHFKQPAPAWYNVFVGAYGMIIPQHIMQDFTGDKARNAPFNLKPIGTGPYKVDDFKSGDSVLYSVNDSFRDPTRPFFNQVQMKGGGDATSAARAVLQTGEVDLAWNLQVEETVLKQLEAAGKGKLAFEEPVNLERILINMTDPNKDVDGERSSLKAPHPWQSDLKVRQAYAYAVQRDVIANQLYGRAGTATANVLVGPKKFVDPNTKWEYNLTKAAAALDDAGWKKGGSGLREKNGVQMKLTYQTSVNSVRQKTQEIVKQAFEQLGMNVTLQSIDASVFFSSDAGNTQTAAHFYADIEMFTNGPSSVYPVDYMVSWWGDPSNVAQKSNQWAGQNYERWQNADYDKAYQQALVELDPQKQVDLFHTMNELVVNNVVSIPLVARATEVIGYANTLSNLQLSPWAPTTWNIGSWTRTS